MRHPVLVRSILTTLTTSVLVALIGGPVQAADGVQALFLGDQGHHQPATRFAWIQDRLEKAGIHATYTEKLTDLSDANLAKYDVVMVYANIKELAPDQEKALTGFVASGHGLAAIHCASACFGANPGVVALMGGKFKSHKTGVFSPKILAPDHPLMKGFKGYTLWDETYLHSDHNPDGRTVLAVREEAGAQEPWTWVREQGKGRVFYTASGHDERTWKDAAYQELLIRGTAWAAGNAGRIVLDQAINGNVPQVVLPPDPNRVALKYEPRPTVQNYEKRTPYPQWQFPLSAADSQAHTAVLPEFELQYFAGEPDIVKPIAFTWDHRGRLYVLQSVDYPNTFTDQWQGHDRIIICEDTKGTGRADKFTVFAEGLNIGTGLTFLNGGIVVTQAPHLLFLKDTDGDDKADVKEVILSGWGKTDTHAGPSNLRYGFDNRLYGSVGYAGFKGENAGKKIDFRQGLWRIGRDMSGLEFVGQFTNNTWGLGFNEGGELFGSTANNAHMFHVAVPIPYLAGLKGLEDNKKAQAAFKMDAHYAAHPITANVRQVDVHGGFSSTAGQALYTARNFPQAYWNRTALVNEPELHLLHQAFLKRDGSGYTEDGDGGNLLASDDEWMAPVHSDVGPDGAVWVADWYNFIIQHNPTPKVSNGGFDTTNGKGNAHENPLRDHERGRIYRIVWKGAKPAPIKALDPQDGPALVRALGDDNLFWRLTAQRLLVERAKDDVVPALIARARDQAVDATGGNGGVIHALWTLHGLKALSGSNAEALAVAVAALRHPAPAVRRNAVQVLPATAASTAAIRASGILADADLNVRLAAVLAVGALPAEEALGAEAFALSRRSEVLTDRWLPLAVQILGARNAPGYVTALLAAPATKDTAQVDRDRLVARNAGVQAPVAFQAGLVARLGETDPTVAALVLDGLVAAWTDRPAPTDLAPDVATRLDSVAQRLEAGNQRRLAQLTERWGIRSAIPTLANLLGAPAKPVAAKVRTADEQKRIEAGKNTYLTLCIACHQPDGAGLAAVAPPLVGSEWVTGDETRLARIVLHGVKGPITAAGKSFNLEMPAFKEAVDDRSLADLLTYLRSDWGNDAPAVDSTKVRAVRFADKERTTPWTVPELDAK